MVKRSRRSPKPRETLANNKTPIDIIKEQKQYNGQFTNTWVSKGRVFNKNNEYMSTEKNDHQKPRSNGRQDTNYYAILNEDEMMEHKCETAYKIAIDMTNQEIEAGQQQMNERIEIITEEYDVEKMTSTALEAFIINKHVKDIAAIEETLNRNCYTTIINFLNVKEIRHMNNQYEDLRDTSVNAEVKYNELILAYKKLNKQYDQLWNDYDEEREHFYHELRRIENFKRKDEERRKQSRYKTKRRNR